MHRAPAGAKFGLREKQKYSPHPGGICISLLLEGSALLRSSRGHEANRSAERPGRPPAGPHRRAWGGCGHTAGHAVVPVGLPPPHTVPPAQGAAWLGRGPAQHWAGVGADPGWSRVPWSRAVMLDPPPSTRAPPMPVPSDACPGPGSCPGAGTALCSLERPSHGLGHPPCPPPPAGVPCVTPGGGNRVTGSDVSPPPHGNGAWLGARSWLGVSAPPWQTLAPAHLPPAPAPPSCPNPQHRGCVPPHSHLCAPNPMGGGWGEQQHRRASPEHPGKRLPIWRGNPGWGREDAQHPWELGTDAG